MSCCVDHCIVDASGTYWLAVADVSETPPVVTYLDLSTGTAGTPVAPTQPCEIPDEEVFVGTPGTDPNVTIGAPEADRGWFYDEDGAAWYWDPTAGTWEQFTSGCCLAQWCVLDAAGDQWNAVVLIDNGVPGTVLYLNQLTGVAGTPVAPVEPCSGGATTAITDNADGTATIDNGTVACVVSVEHEDFACVDGALEHTTTDLKTGVATLVRSHPEWVTANAFTTTFTVSDSTSGGRFALLGVPLTASIDLPPCGGYIRIDVVGGYFARASTVGGPTTVSDGGYLSFRPVVNWLGGSPSPLAGGVGINTGATFTAYARVNSDLTGDPWRFNDEIPWSGTGISPLLPGGTHVVNFDLMVWEQFLTTGEVMHLHTGMTLSTYKEVCC